MQLGRKMIAKRISLALFLIPLAPDVSAAQQAGQQLLGQFQDWSAYTAKSGSGKVCFVISQPKSRAPDGLNRDPAYFFISTRPADNVRNEVSVQFGFPTREGSSADLSVGPASFSLIAQNGRAWTNGSDDARIVSAMRAGADMTIKSTSTRGNVTTDTYSLSGVTAAIDRAAQECR